MKKTVVLGVTGCIAAYKACEITSSLYKLGYDVRVIMTENAKEFVTPLTFETLSRNKVASSTFEKDREFEVEHVSYAKLADAFVIAPATANIISKIARGIADDMLSTTIMATKAPKIICPAMNTAMYENPLFLENLEKLRKLGYIVVEPDEGMLACGDIGKGRLASPKSIAERVDSLLTPNPDLRGKTLLVTAGATIEPIDPVRYITNRSSGKMGIAIAEAALERGAKVALIHGNVKVDLPKGSENVYAPTNEKMLEELLKRIEYADIIIKAAAPSDYKVESFSKEKVKSDDLTLQLSKNLDIAESIGKSKGDRKLVIFAAETSELLKNAKGKLESKHADMAVANDVLQEGAGFDVDTNIATLLFKDGSKKELEKMPKAKLAHVILDHVLKLD